MKYYLIVCGNQHEVLHCFNRIKAMINPYVKRIDGFTLHTDTCVVKVVTTYDYERNYTYYNSSGCWLVSGATAFEDKLRTYFKEVGDAISEEM